MSDRPQDNSTDTGRLLDIIMTVSRHKPAQGLTPEKLCDIMRDLGPTFVKLGQLLSMHPEILPPEYCRALEALRTDAKQLVTAQMREIISAEYGRPWNTVFSRILPFPVGSASIAQVHEAVLLDGTHVAVKIQRPDIYATMERDVRLIKKALSILKFRTINAINSVMDIVDIIDEVWRVAKEEMDFEKEAANIKLLRKNTEGIEYVYCPKVYEELSTKNVLVMEFIGGFELNDIEGMKNAGYDMAEVCTKFINNYIKQFAEDKFFHADPHPGNIRVQDGQIVWLDLGMMGRLSDQDAANFTRAMHAIFINDVYEFTDAVIELCHFLEPPDREAMVDCFRGYLDKYRAVSMEEMTSSSDIFEELFKISSKFGLSVPRGLTMIWRSLLVMEGTVAMLSPDTNLAAIIGKHLAAQALGKGLAGTIARSISHKKLMSGTRLSHNGYRPDPDDAGGDYVDEQSLEELKAMARAEEAVAR